MRTNAEENARLGKILADKANAATGPVAFLLPLRGTCPSHIYALSRDARL
jgi:uncharacterized protein (UPF0261 family)